MGCVSLLVWNHNLIEDSHKSDCNSIEVAFFSPSSQKKEYTQGKRKVEIKHDRNKEKKGTCHMEEDPCLSLWRLQTLVCKQAASFGVGTTLLLENGPAPWYSFWDDVGSSTGDARYCVKKRCQWLVLLKLNWSSLESRSSVYLFLFLMKGLSIFAFSNLHLSPYKPLCLPWTSPIIFNGAYFRWC